jgi:hypothetical protein
MKSLPLSSQKNAEFTASLPFSQHSCRKGSRLFAALEQAEKNRSIKSGSVGERRTLCERQFEKSKIREVFCFSICYNGLMTRSCPSHSREITSLIEKNCKSSDHSLAAEFKR